LEPAPLKGRALALGAILVLAAAVRFVGLGWGLRHEPHWDERVFVENVQQMAERGDLDHRYYEYPGLFFYLLRPAMAVAPHRAGPYLAARAVVALFGVIGCAAVYLLGRALAGPTVGLVGALLLAVSPVAVHTAHMVRPDVVLQVFVTLALLALLRVGERPRGDLLAGTAIGLATAVKFSGAFLLPSYLLRRALSPGPRLRGMVVAAAGAAAVFLVATPYAVLNAPEFVAGVQTQVGYHYEESEGAAASPFGLVLAYLLGWPRALGLPAILFALAGTVIALRADARRWLPLLCLPLVTVAVMGSQRFLFSRHLLPSLGVPALLAGLAVERLARVASRRFALPPAVASGALGLLLAALPLAHSVAYVREIARPGTRDLALDWAEANVPDGARVLSTVERLGLDERRMELTEVLRLGPHDRPLPLEMDYVLATAADDARALEGLVEQARFEPGSAVAGPTIRALVVPVALRPSYRPVAVEPGMLSASENAAELARACDGDSETLWRTLDPQRPGDWLAVALGAPVDLARIELRLGPHGRLAARELQVAVSPDGDTWTDVRSRPARPPLDRQRPEAGAGSQVLVLTPPVHTRFIRIGLRRSGAHRWGVAELRLLAVP
jgi:4-amino-4-deoxy-L-arabinose transferase-like glycosyltransferase